MDRGKLKKLKKQLAKGAGTATDCLNVYGTDALAELELLPSHVCEQPPAVSVRDVQNLLFWALTPELGDMPRWISVRNKPLIRGAVFVFAPGLGAVSAGAGWTPPVPVRLPKAQRSRLAESVAAELVQARPRIE